MKVRAHPGRCVASRIGQLLTVHSVHNPENRHLEGRTIGDIAAEQRKTPFDAMLDLAIAEGLRTSFMPPAVGGDEALWKVRGQLWTDDRTVIGASDAGAHLDMIDTFAFSTQVLGNGVREHQVIGLEQAIHQLTQVPAELFGLRERGLLREGWYADIVVFDPRTVGSGPVHMRPDLPCNEPRIYADAYGVDHVFVNGVQIIRDGQHTQARPGKALRSGQDTYTPIMKTRHGGDRHARTRGLTGGSGRVLCCASWRGTLPHPTRRSRHEFFHQQPGRPGVPGTLRLRRSARRDDD